MADALKALDLEGPNREALDWRGSASLNSGDKNAPSNPGIKHPANLRDRDRHGYPCHQGANRVW